MIQYNRADKAAERIKKKIRIKANRLDTISFDELNAPQVTKATEDALNDLLAVNLEEYIAIAKDAKKQAYIECEEAGFTPKGSDITEAFILAMILNAFNPITGYLYFSEADRKRLRLAEGLNTAKALTNKALQHTVVRGFANNWYTQSRQYADTTVDTTVEDTYRKSGVKYVQWIAELDEKTCEECRERNLKVFPIDSVPPKPHYHCRCTLKPYKKEDTNSES